MIPAGTLLTGSYDHLVVALSVVIAVAASYAALDLAGRVTASKGWPFAAWLTCGSIAMGIGIWSMHFTGMLAFSLPVPVSYYWPTVLLSYVVAVARRRSGTLCRKPQGNEQRSRCGQWRRDGLWNCGLTLHRHGGYADDCRLPL